MSVFGAVLAGVFMGFVFGFALEKSSVCQPGKIACQMGLTDFTMLKVFLSAIVTGLLVLAFLHGFGFVKLHPKATLWAGNIVGGAILGIGIAVARACPGTAPAQIGAGLRRGWVVFLGGIAGAMAFGYLEPTLRPILLSGGPGKLTVDGLLGIPFWTAALGMAMICTGCIFGLETWERARDR